MEKYYYAYNNTLKDSNWKEYKLKIEKFISNKITLKGKTIILGFGGGNDIPLEFLLQNSTNLLVTDIDYKNMSISLDRVSKSIERLSMDYLGENYYNIDVCGDIIRQIQGIEFEIPKKLSNDKFDTIIVAPIFSQLFYYPFVEIFKKSNIVITDEIHREISLKTAQAIEHFVKLIKYISKENAEIFIWQDILEDKEKFNVDMGREIIVKYTKKYGLSPTTYGVELLKREFKFCDEVFLNWNLSENRNLLVELMYFNKK